MGTVAHVLLPFYALGTGIEYSKNSLYLRSTQGVTVLDIKDGLNPKVISSIAVDVFSNIQASEDSLVLLRNSGKDFTIISVEDPSHPRIIRSIPWPTAGNLEPSHSIQVFEGFCYAFSQQSSKPVSFTVVNVTNSLVPHIVGTLAMPTLKSATLATHGDYCYISDVPSYVLSVIDIANKAHPRFVSSLKDIMFVKMVAYNNTLFGGTNTGIKIIDINNPSKLKVIGSVLLQDYMTTLKIVDSFLYAQGEKAIYRLDISDPVTPILVLSFETPSFKTGTNTQFECSSHYCYFGHVANTQGLLTLYTVTLGDSFRLFGTPEPGTKGNYTVELRAKQENTTLGTKTFNWEINPAILVNANIPNQIVRIGTVYSYNIGVFSHVRHLPLRYRANVANSTNLPEWLRLNAVSGAFSGTPSAHDAGLVHLVAHAGDKLGATASTDFDLRVLHGPHLNHLIPNQLAFFREPFSFTFAQDTFIDQDNYPFKYQVAADGKGLPSWLTFDPEARTFSGEPKITDRGSISISVDAIDPFNVTASDRFTIEAVPELPPIVLNPISNLGVNVGENLHFVVPKTTFGDPYGREINYVYSASLTDSTPLPAWLFFDPKSRTFSGIPGRGDTGFYSPRRLEILLTATKLTTSKAARFEISVTGTSYGEIALKVVGPIVTAMTALYGAYKTRGRYWNQCRSGKYQKPPQRVSIGQAYTYSMETDRREVDYVQCLLENEKLPCGNLLPSWLEYDLGTNSLKSGAVPDCGNVDVLTIQVIDKIGRIREQFELRIQAEEEGDESAALLAQGAGSVQ